MWWIARVVVQTVQKHLPNQTRRHLANQLIPKWQLKVSKDQQVGAASATTRSFTLIGGLSASAGWRGRQENTQIGTDEHREVRSCIRAGFIAGGQVACGNMSTAAVCFLTHVYTWSTHACDDSYLGYCWNVALVCRNFWILVSMYKQININDFKWNFLSNDKQYFLRVFPFRHEKYRTIKINIMTVIDIIDSIQWDTKRMTYFEK